MSSPRQWVPKPYQQAVVAHLLSHPHAALLLDPGLGKTSCVLAALTVLKGKRMFKRALVVAPARVAQTVWTSERTKWVDFWGLPMHVLHGPKKDQLLDSLNDPSYDNPDVCTVSYEGLDWLARDAGAGFRALGADVIVFDESTFIRHTNTRRFKNVKPYLHTFGRRMILTGTPIPRSYEDLFGQFYVVDQGAALGRYITHFRMQYFDNVGVQFPDWRVRPSAVPIINEKIHPLTLRGDANELLDLPRLLLNDIVVDLPESVRPMYRTLEKQFYVALEGGAEIMSPTAAALGNKLRQVASGFAYDESGQAINLHDEKLDALMELVSSLQGKPAFLLYEFLADAAKVEKALGRAGVRYGRLDGKKGDERLMREFNAGELPILLAHPASAGHGLNLQDTASHVIWYGPTWNLEHYDQAVRRVYRQGNPNAHVTIHTIVARETKDERVAEVLQAKDKTQRALLSALRRV